MLNEILADVKQEGADPFKDFEPKADQEKETPSESQTEKEPEVEKPVQGDNTDDINIPFNKRWEKHAENLKAELEAKHQAELTQLRQEFDAKIPPKQTNIPERFKQLYGDNEEAWKLYQEEWKEREAEIEKNIIERQAQNHQKAEQEKQYWLNWADEGAKKISDKFGVDLISKNDKDENGQPMNALKNELFSVMLKYRPTDEQNMFDFEAGWEILQALKAKEADPAHSQARKKLADTTTKSSPAEKGSKGYMTSNDLRNKTWNQL